MIQTHRAEGDPCWLWDSVLPNSSAAPHNAVLDCLVQAMPGLWVPAEGAERGGKKIKMGRKEAGVGMEAVRRVSAVAERNAGAQGVMGSVPWQGMVFFTLWLQLKGLPNAAAAAVYATFLTGTAIGGALGGFLGDRASLLSPNHGRIIISQVSVALGLPLSFLIIKVPQPCSLCSGKSRRFLPSLLRQCLLHVRRGKLAEVTLTIIGGVAELQCFPAIAEVLVGCRRLWMMLCGHKGVGVSQVRVSEW